MSLTPFNKGIIEAVITSVGAMSVPAQEQNLDISGPQVPNIKEVAQQGMSIAELPPRAALSIMVNEGIDVSAPFERYKASHPENSEQSLGQFFDKHGGVGFANMLNEFNNSSKASEEWKHKFHTIQTVIGSFEFREAVNLTQLKGESPVYYDIFSTVKRDLQLQKVAKNRVSIKDHPFYGTLQLDREHIRDFLTGFDPRKIDTTHQLDPKVLAIQVTPLDSTIPFNAGQILFKVHLSPLRDEKVDAVNMNADLGLQWTLENVLRHNVITTDHDGLEKPAFVIVSSGHAIAGLAQLAKMTRIGPDGKEQFLFDTSIYMPMGKWTKDTGRIAVATGGAQIWGDEIARARLEHKQKDMTSAGGVAIGLNGHRGELELDDSKGGIRGSANINAANMLGTPDEFVTDLKRRGLDRVVIVTEHYLPGPDQADIPYILDLEHLRNSKGGMDYHRADISNEDLYDYMKKLKARGVNVMVVSGEQRVEYK